MNSKKIETNSILHLRKELEFCPHVSTDIPDNDRTPSWDGDIFLYNTDKLEKKNMYGVIRVQVKGKKVRKGILKTDEISYPVEVADLKNFRSAGGTIFFVVYIADDNHYKIYYNSLLPIDLEEYLSKVEVNQKSKSIKLIKFPNRKKDMIFYILSNFIKDSRKQQSTAKTGYMNDARIAQYDKLILSIPKKDMFKYMFQIPTYIYGQKKGIDVEIPLNKVFLKSLGSNNIKMQVKVGNNTFYDKISVEEDYDKTILRIGKGFTTALNREKEKQTVTLNYVHKGYLEERIQDLKFIQSLLKEKSLQIGYFAEGTDIQMAGIEITEIEKNLEFYNDLQKFMIILKVTDKIDLDSLTEKNYRELEIIRKGIVDKIPVYFNDKNEKLFWGKYRIGNLVLGILAERNINGNYNIKSIFDEEIAGQCIMKPKKNGELKEIPSCIYILLEKEDFLKLSNICHETMLKKLMSVPYSEEYGSAVTFLILEMLSAFNEKTQDSELINTIITITKWLTYQEDGNCIFIINYLQSIKRTRKLDKEELDKLHEIKENEIKKGYDLYILSSISILLENKADFSYYFAKMNPKDKENFINWPIYKLAGELY